MNENCATSIPIECMFIEPPQWREEKETFGCPRNYDKLNFGVNFLRCCCCLCFFISICKLKQPRQENSIKYRFCLEIGLSLAVKLSSVSFCGFLLGKIRRLIDEFLYSTALSLSLCGFFFFFIF